MACSDRRPRRLLLIAFGLSGAIAMTGCFDWTVPTSRPDGGSSSSAGGQGGTSSASSAIQGPGSNSTSTTSGGWGSAECAQCVDKALAGSCASQSQACEADTGCAAVLACISEKCPNGDAACVDTCLQQSQPDSMKLAYVLEQCVICQTCAVACGGSPYCP